MVETISTLGVVVFAWLLPGLVVLARYVLDERAPPEIPVKLFFTIAFCWPVGLRLLRAIREEPPETERMS